MTIIKKRGRIVRNIFVIDRYDAPHRVPTGCWEEMLSRMYSVDPNADSTNRMSDIQRSFSDPKVEKSKWKAIACSYRAKCFEALYFLPLDPISKGSFTNYNAHEAQTLATV